MSTLTLRNGKGGHVQDRSTNTAAAIEPGTRRSRRPPAEGPGHEQRTVRRERDEAVADTRAVIEVLGALAGATNAAEAAAAALGSVRAAFGWTYGSFWSLSDDGKSMGFVSASGTVNADFQRATQGASFQEGQGLVGGAWQRRGMFFVDDIGAMNGFGRAAAAAQAGIVSALCIPLFTGNEVTGALDFFTKERLAPSAARLEVLGSVGRLVSQTIERLSMNERDRERGADTVAVNKVFEGMERATDVDGAARLALEAVRTAFGWSYGSYWILDRDAGLLRYAVESGSVNAEFQAATHKATFQEGKGLPGGAWKSRDMVFVEDLEKMAGFARAESARRGGIRSAMCLPLLVKGELLGAMDFFAQSTIKATESRLAALRNVGRLVSSALERISAQERERAQAEDLRTKVDQILVVVAAATKGDLTTAMPVAGTDAVGRLGESLAQFLADLRRSVGRISGNAQTVAASAEELTATAKQMSGNARETADQAGVVSAASEQVSRNVQSVAVSSEQMSLSIREIAKNAADASRVASEAVRVTENTSSTVRRLGDSSREIGKVVKVITSIAQQTNLLALNATIEAARAGEAGKGFSVVANEVKELAKETAKATEDIGRKIEAIQGDTKAAVGAIEQISAIIGQISDIQSAIATAVEEQTAATAEIGRNVSEAAKGTTEIAGNIAQVATAAESTNLGANDTQMASEGLARLATELQGLVGRFKH